VGVDKYEFFDISVPFSSVFRYDGFLNCNESEERAEVPRSRFVYVEEGVLKAEVDNDDNPGFENDGI
jgi:hypothetical protein